MLGGSGQGEQIAANKVPGCAPSSQRPFHRATSREHNDANVLSMGGRIVALGLADEILELWLKTTSPADGISAARPIAEAESAAQ